MVRRCYIYLGDKWTDKKWKNPICWAVLRKNGKCIRGQGNMLVEFSGHRKVVVVARRLRRIDKLYPYLPKNRKILYVKPDNKFMREATELLKKSGCLKQATAAVVVKNGKIIGRGANAGKRVDVCPRIVHNCPTGTGYEYCKDVCKQEGHAEVTAIRDALKKTKNLKGASLYLDGHWWMCKPCWDEIIRVGISRGYLRKNSRELYKK